MKKNYNQPIVETTNFITCGQALCGSPTTPLPIIPTPIPGEGD